MQCSTSTRIQWNKYFDAIYCIYFLPNKKRKPILEQELDKLNIRDSGIFKYRYSFLTPYTYYINLNTPYDSYLLGQYEGIYKYTNLVLTRYSIFQEALLRGYNHILIIEDDLLVLRDPQDYISVLDHLPSEWDFIQFDRIPAKGWEHCLNEMKDINEYFATYTGGYWGKVMAGYGEKVMRMCRDVLEKKIYCSDGIIDNNRDLDLSGFKRFITKPVLCIQRGRDKNYKEGV